MEIIKCLAEYIEEELHDAEKYAKAALHQKGTDRDLCQTFEDLARQELSHSDKLHAQAVRLINAKKAAGVTAPASMEIIYNWEHGKMIDKTAHVHRLLDMLKG